MSQPTPYARAYSFTDHSANFPSTPHPGVSLDTEFEAVELTLGQLCTNIALIQRDDGALANGSVGADQLSSDVVVGLRSIDDWATGASYVVRDAVWYENRLYRCLENHTAAAAFATDLAAERWILQLDPVPYAQAAAEQAVTAEVLAGIDINVDLGPINTALAGKASLADANVFSGANTFNQSVSLLGGFSAAVSTAVSAADYWKAQPTDYAAGKPRVVLRKATTAALWQLQLEDTGGPAGTLNIIASTIQLNGSAPWTAANFDPDAKLNVVDLPDNPTQTEARRIATRRALVF